MLSFGAIYKAVALEAFLWGFGTAIGELPPYFVAKAASAAGKTHEELEEFLGSTQSDDSALSRLKMKGFRFLKRNAFVAVTLAASIPNPLFDLAGITCGHLQIPFTVFFVSTMIGKAINKVSIQVCFIIFAFSKHRVSAVLSLIEKV